MKYLSFFILSIFFFTTCGTVPITGRKQLSLVSNHEVLTLSNQEYDKFMHESKKSTNQTNTATVVRVGRNIANAVETFLRKNGYQDMIADFTWEFNLVQNNEANAFCMPGGKIVVYEGILPFTRDDTGLAVVLGHEVAHAVAKHSNERMSQQLVSQLGGVALGVAMSEQPEKTQQMALAVYGLGSQFGILLPYSRKQELEADHLGLIFMTMAGYDPRQAPAFWERMSQQGGKGPEFLSTHPSDEHRMQELQKEMPEALKYAGQSVTNNSNSTKGTQTSKKWSF